MKHLPYTSMGGNEITDKSPTRIAGDSISSPDTTLINPAFLQLKNLSAVTSLDSNPEPIVTKLNRNSTKTYKSRRTLVNFTKCNWFGFMNLIEELQQSTNFH